MIVVDTNVLSAIMEAPRHEAVLQWLDLQASETIWTTSITLFESYYGIERLAKGQRRNALRDALDKALANVVQGRILNFDEPASYEAAVLLAEREMRGKIIDLRDTLIAGIVRARKATLATRNTKHFSDAGIRLADPWNAAE